MATVLVTGGATEVGRRAAIELERRGYTVRVLVDREGPRIAGVSQIVGDVGGDHDLAEAVDGAEAVVHTGVTGRRRGPRHEVEAARAVAEAAEGVGAHLVYVSLVGASTTRAAAFRARRRAELVIDEVTSRWSVQRVTQTHQHVEGLLAGLVCAKAPSLAYQPVDPADVARRLADVVEAGPSGRVPDFGGPELLGIETLAKRRRAITGRRSRLVRLPAVGPLRDLYAGRHLSPAHRDGTVSWNRWLEASMNGG